VTSQRSHKSGFKFATRPLYVLVRDSLVQRIVAGDWKPGQALPNEYELSRGHGVSIGTVRKALAQLEDERLINRVQGRGTFVADHSTGDLAIRFSNLRDPHGNPIHGQVADAKWSRGTANSEEMERLKLSRPAEVLRVTRSRTFQDHAFVWDQCTLPVALFPKLPEDVADYRISALAQENHLLLARGIETVSAQLAGPEDARRLAIAEHTPILELDRVVLCDDDRVAEWRVARCYLRELKYLAETS
jgi:GntR family transcriptional regulator